MANEIIVEKSTVKTVMPAKKVIVSSKTLAQSLASDPKKTKPVTRASLVEEAMATENFELDGHDMLDSTLNDTL